MKLKLYEGRKQVESILSPIEEGKEYVDFILNIDPSRTKKYADIIAKWLKKYYFEFKTINLDSEQNKYLIKKKIKDRTARLPELITKAEARNIAFDLSKIDEIDELIEILEEKTKKITRSSIKKGFVGLTLDKDYGIIIQNPNYIGVMPYSWEASRALASKEVGGIEGKWCIAYQKTSEYWENIVLKRGQAPCFLISLDQNNAWKYAFMVLSDETIDVWSSEDNKVSLKRVKEILNLEEKDIDSIKGVSRKKAIANIESFEETIPNIFHNISCSFELEDERNSEFYCSVSREKVTAYDNDDFDIEEEDYVSSKGNFYTGEFFLNNDLGIELLDKYIRYCAKQEIDPIDIINNSIVFVYQKNEKTYSSLIREAGDWEYHDFEENIGYNIEKLLKGKLTIITIANEVKEYTSEPGVENLIRSNRDSYKQIELELTGNYDANIITIQENLLPKRYTSDFIRDDTREAQYGQQFMKYEHKKLMNYLKKFYEKRPRL